MRTLRIFFLSVLAMAGLAFLAVFFGRELLLIMAGNDLKDARQYLIKNSKLNQCQDSFAISKTAWSQIRFIDQRHYNLETVCSDFPTKPVLLEQRTLPILVKKGAGASGFIFDEAANPSQLVLTAFGKHLTVYSEANDISYGQAPILAYTMGPASSCQAFNYQCCQAEVEQGVGEAQGLATDCPKNCHQSCQTRPLLLSFNGQPLSNVDSKLVELRAGQTATFAFVLSDGQQELFTNQVFEPKNTAAEDLEATVSLAKKKESLSDLFDQLLVFFSPAKSNRAQLPIQTTISFGDGQIYQTTDLQGSVEHVYTCATATCYFEVQLQAQDATQIPSVLNELSHLTVKVSN